MAWGVHEVPGAVGRLVCQELLLLGMEADVVAKAPVGSPAGRPGETPQDTCKSLSQMVSCFFRG